jgi:uncharacterized membrane protein
LFFIGLLLIFSGITFLLIAAWRQGWQAIFWWLPSDQAIYRLVVPPFRFLQRHISRRTVIAFSFVSAGVMIICVGIVTVVVISQFNSKPEKQDIKPQFIGQHDPNVIYIDPEPSPHLVGTQIAPKKDTPEDAARRRKAALAALDK